MKIDRPKFEAFLEQVKAAGYQVVAAEIHAVQGNSDYEIAAVSVDKGNLNYNFSVCAKELDDPARTVLAFDTDAKTYVELFKDKAAA